MPLELNQERLPQGKAVENIQFTSFTPDAMGEILDILRIETKTLLEYFGELECREELIMEGVESVNNPEEKIDEAREIRDRIQYLAEIIYKRLEDEEKRENKKKETITFH
ncbi:hypothetical protein ACFL6I_15530 [candidate division KSB1 bacterium]